MVVCPCVLTWSPSVILCILIVSFKHISSTAMKPVTKFSHINEMFKCCVSKDSHMINCSGLWFGWSLIYISLWGSSHCTELKKKIFIFYGMLLLIRSTVKSTSGYCISSKFGSHHELQGVSPHYFILGLQGIQHHLPAPADTYIHLAHNCHPHINKR